LISYILSVHFPYTESEVDLARTVRNAKLDTRTARSKLAERREPYWQVVSAGCAIGYRRGAKGGSWIARWRGEDGRQRYESLGAADDARDADGLSVLSFRQGQDRARAWFAAKVRAQAGDLMPLGRRYTIADAFADYRADYLRRSGKATVDLDYAARMFLPTLGPVELAKLTKRQVMAWHQVIAETPARLRTKRDAEQRYREADARPETIRRRQASANRVLAVLKATLNHAHREGRVAGDEAWRTVRAYRGTVAARVRYLSDDDALRLVDACPTADFRQLVTAALLTGCRYGELARMTGADFSPDAGTVAVRLSKSGRPRHVVLTPEGIGFFASLAAGKDAGALLFVRDNGKPWRKSNQRRPLVAACKAAGVEIAFHELRHTYASRLVMAGAPLMVAARQLGHVDTRMVEKHYGHLAPNYVADTVRATFHKLGIVEPSNVVPLRSAM
jgi:integrase